MHAPQDEDGERVKKYSSRFQTALSFSHESISFAFAAHGLPRRAKRSGTRGAFSPRHSGAQAKHASPESIPTVRGYGFRPSPLSRLGRNDEVKASAPNNTSSFPRRVFRARVLFFASLTPIEGVAERRESSGACEAPVGPARNAAGQAPSEAPCVPYGGRSPPGAPPWRFWAPVPRFPHRNCFRIGHSELLASGS